MADSSGDSENVPDDPNQVQDDVGIEDASFPLTGQPLLDVDMPSFVPPSQPTSDTDDQQPEQVSQSQRVTSEAGVIDIVLCVILSRHFGKN